MNEDNWTETLRKMIELKLFSIFSDYFELQKKKYDEIIIRILFVCVKRVVNEEKGTLQKKLQEILEASSLSNTLNRIANEEAGEKEREMIENVLHFMGIE